MASLRRVCRVNSPFAGPDAITWVKIAQLRAIDFLGDMAANIAALSSGVSPCAAPMAHTNLPQSPYHVDGQALSWPDRTAINRPIICHCTFGCAHFDAMVIHSPTIIICNAVGFTGCT